MRTKRLFAALLAACLSLALALPCAAAFTAAADLAAAEGGAASFSAGDISVSLGGVQDRARRAESLRQAAEGLMEPFVRAAGLWAQGVEG